jgi:hydrogenase maturation factor
LLISVADEDGNRLLQQLRERGIEASEIGDVVAQDQDVTARILII